MQVSYSYVSRKVFNLCEIFYMDLRATRTTCITFSFSFRAFCPVLSQGERTRWLLRSCGSGSFVIECWIVRNDRIVSRAARWCRTKISGRKAEKRNNVIYKSFDSMGPFRRDCFASLPLGDFINFRIGFTLRLSRATRQVYLFFITHFNLGFAALG